MRKAIREHIQLVLIGPVGPAVGPEPADRDDLIEGNADTSVARGVCPRLVALTSRETRSWPHWTRTFAARAMPGPNGQWQVALRLRSSRGCT